MKLQVINNSGVLLRYATDGSAGIDLPAGFPIKFDGDTRLYNTEITVAIPVGHVGLLIPRSSLHMRGLELGNQVGVIDPDVEEVIAQSMEYGIIQLLQQCGKQLTKAAGGTQ